MMRWIVWAVLCLCLAACGKQEAPRANASVEGAAPPSTKEATPSKDQQVQAGVTQRHVELRHSLEIEVAGDKLAGVWRTRLDACQLPDCELVSATINNHGDDYATAQIALRVVLAQASGLLQTLYGLGKVTRHEMGQKDRTNEIIDLEARLNSQKALRDRLRALLAGRVDKISDLFEVERELARVQSEIDSLDGQMRATLQLTEKTSIDITLRTPPSFAHSGTWEPLSRAWSSIGRTLAESLSVLMTVVSAVLPWAVFFGLLVYGVRRFRQRRRASVNENTPELNEPSE